MMHSFQMMYNTMGSKVDGLADNVVLLGRASFLTGVIAAQSQQTLKFSVRPQK